MRKVTKALAAAGGMLLLGGLIPAQATPLAPQQNVRHVTNVPGSTGGHSVVEGNRLYVGAYGLGLTVFDISNPAAPTKIGEYKPVLGQAGFTPSSSDPGLRADAVPDAAVFDGRHIVALNGTSRAAATRQTEFLDMTDPDSPVLLHRLPAPQGEAHNGDIVDSRRLWLPSGSATPNFRIYDLNPLLQTPPAAPTLVSPSNFNLVTAWNQSPFRNGRPTGPAFTHIHDIEIYTDLEVLLPESDWVDSTGDGVADPTYGPRDMAFVAEGGNYVGNGNTGSFFVVDITDPTTPVVRLRYLHPSGAGHHPWRYFHEIQLLDGDRHIGFVSDEDLHNGCDAGGVMSVRFTEDYTSATELDEWFVGTGTPAGVCSAHVFSSHGNYVFMGAYQAGLQVIDFTNPADLKRAGQYIAEGANSWGALYHKGYVYVGDFGARGLDVFEFIPNPAASALLKVNNPGTRTTAGIAEHGCETLQDPYGPTNGTDGLIVPIPADKRDGTHKIRAVGSSSGVPYDLDVWFHDEACVGLTGTGLSSDSPDEFGTIPEGAAFASVDLYTGPPTYTYVQIDP